MSKTQIIQRAEVLPELYADRVRPGDLDGMRSLAGAGEWWELVDLLAASLGLTQAPVSAQEYEDLRQLFADMDMPNDRLERLNVEG
jgi:hypothetical protein